jgi:hypothetical protein
MQTDFQLTDTPTTAMCIGNVATSSFSREAPDSSRWTEEQDVRQHDADSVSIQTDFQLTNAPTTAAYIVNAADFGQPKDDRGLCQLGDNHFVPDSIYRAETGRELGPGNEYTDSSDD